MKQKKLRDLALLQWWGTILDEPPVISSKRMAAELASGVLWAETMRDLLIQELLRIRTKTRKTQFRLNRCQTEYSKRAMRKNIVLKARRIRTEVAAGPRLRTGNRPEYRIAVWESAWSGEEGLCHCVHHNRAAVKRGTQQSRHRR
jgi:hypothetical protein